jgi:carboxypeptidase family protein
MGNTTAVLIALIGLGTGLMFAQGSTATIIGTVQDVSGAALPGVEITVKHMETGLTRKAQADARGNYSVPALPVGAYEVTAEKMGYSREVRLGTDLVVAQQAVVNLTLQVGSVEQQLTVTEAVPLVSATLNSTSGLISEQQIKDLPLNGRSFDQLLMVNAGTVNNTSNSSGWSAFSLAGKRPETNRFLINKIDWVGGNAANLFITPLGTSGKLLGVEAVREFNAIPHTYGAEYGKRAGGQVSIVTSSGTNQLHGALFEYLRNSALDARDFFDQTIGTPPFKRHQFGGALGGPLKKNKLFLFGNYEEFRQRLALSNVAIVPDDNARQGLLPNGSPIPNLKTAMLPYVNAFWPAPNGPGLTGGAAFNYNNPLQSIREDFGLTRFDYTISSRDSFSANYTIDNGERHVPQTNPNFVQNQDLHSQTLGFDETHVFSPSVVNVATLGYARSFAIQVVAPAIPIPPNLVFMPGGNPGSIAIGIGGGFAITPAGGNNPTQAVRNYFTEADDLRVTKGKHSLSTGGWVQRVQQVAAGAALASAGAVVYPTVLAFLQDQPSQAVVIRNPVPVGYRSLEAAWYVQDEIKLLPNLTTRLGLRDEMTNGWNEVANRCINYFFDPNFVIQTNPHIGGSCLAQNNAKALWQPRVGLAWDPTGRGTWAVRAGFGIHNDLLDNLANRTYVNPPIAANEQLTIPAGGFLSLLPLKKSALLLPTCGPSIPQPCSIYQPGGIDPNMFTPTIQQWSFTVERQTAKDLMLQVSYVGSQSYHTSLTMNSNTAPPQVCQNPQGCISGGVLPASQRAVVPQGMTYMAPGTRPNPYVSSTVSWWDQGTSSYHSLNVSLQKRASYGLTFKVNYSYAKVMDLNSALVGSAGANGPPNVFSPYNLFLNRGVASYSLNHQFNANFSYQLPFGSGQHFAGGARGLWSQLIGGWQWNGIVTAQGGFPFTPLIGFNSSGTGNQSVSDVPNRNPNFSGPVVLGKPDQWFDPRAFLVPTAGTLGNVSRGSLRGPGLVNVDTSLFKNFKTSERLLLQFRAEAFNIFNHSNFSYPNQVTFVGNNNSYSIGPSAGVITAAATTSRQLQFALKLLF